MFNFVSEKITSSTKVVEYIQQLIINNELKPETKLPAERDLAIMMNVSRPTIREAYKILSALGFIKIQHGQGVYVQNPKQRMDMFATTFFQTESSIFELFEIRKTLEPEAAYWGAVRATDEQLETLLKNVNGFYERVMSSEVDASMFEQADHDFHSLVADCAKNSVYTGIMNNLILLLKKVRTHTLQIPGRSLMSLKEHQYIAQAMHTRKGNEAKQFMIDHLNSVEQTLKTAFQEQRKEVNK
ncbi:FadR/GntR family transcriptional regulator [Bacillus sp. FJAT-44742]|uniref:FadR/GntR family transcriptional regulator n=1 Tax=Bacillus sp. FJAT-44742 TaxID=2014005 RepID=UPI000C240A14|nr:FadR/GntR family transcriptional regulator [Bacillus sp. FJAT-44742]